MEVQRALECGETNSPVNKRGNKAPQKFELNFPEFQKRLLDLGVGWLSIGQQRVIFNTIDVDESGTITEEELKGIEEQRMRLEMERERTLEEHMAARAAAEAEAAERAEAEAKEAQAAKEAAAEEKMAAVLARS